MRTNIRDLKMFVPPANKRKYTKFKSKTKQQGIISSYLGFLIILINLEIKDY